MSQFRGAKNGGFFGSNLSQPIKIDLNFVVDSTNGNGLGIRSLKSNGWVRNVFMHTSSTPGANNGATNPNPAAGYALVQLKQNFNLYVGGFSGYVSPVVSPTTAITSGLTAGAAYIITVLGTTTLAEWQTIGLPAGLTPTVGQSFIATATGTGGSHTGKVGLPSVSGITSVEVVGDPNQSISNSSIASNGGAYLLVQFLKASTSAVVSTLTMDSYTPAGTITNGTPDTFAGTPAVLTGTIVNTGGATTLALAAPANGSVVGMSIFMDQSSADPIMQNGDPSST